MTWIAYLVRKRLKYKVLGLPEETSHGGGRADPAPRDGGYFSSTEAARGSSFM